MVTHGSHLWSEGVGSPPVFLSSTYNAERVCRTGQFALWIFGGSSPCPRGAFGVCSRAQDVVLDVETDTPFHVFKEMALKGLQFVSLGPWLSLTGATRLSLDSTSHGDLRALPSPQFGAVKPLWAPDCLRYPLPDTVNDSGGPSGLHASKTSAAG